MSKKVSKKKVKKTNSSNFLKNLKSESIKDAALGVPGLKKVFKGEEPKRSNTILLTGVPGAGKSVFALQFIYGGALRGEAGVFIAYEESADAVRSLAASIGFDKFEELEKKGLIKIVEQPAGRGKITTIGGPLSYIRSSKCKRVALDSLTLFQFVYSKDDKDFRKGVIEFLNNMRKSNISLLATTERTIGDIDNFKHEAQDFLFDGLIVLLRLRKGSTFERVLSVLKMRGQDHIMNLFPFSIKKKGIEVFPEQIPFSLIEKDN